MLRRIATVGAVLAAFALGSANAQELGGDEPETPRVTDTRVNSLEDDDDDDDDFDIGWIGLLGLAGLAGLIPRNHHDRSDRAAGHTNAR